MIYTVIGMRIGGGNVDLKSNSRNACRHLLENNLEFVSVYDNKGNLVSHAEKYANMILYGAVRK